MLKYSYELTDEDLSAVSGGLSAEVDAISSSSAKYKQVSVMSYDTIDSIAARCGISVDRLCSINGITNKKAQLPDKLLVPVR